MRKIFIFGNGLGMSLSHVAYDLTRVMADVWSKNFKDVEQKKLILACLPDGAVRPESEEQLATLQRVVGACEVLKRVPEATVGHWLSEHGQAFPDAVYRFSFLVARAMHLATYPDGEFAGQSCELPSEFSDPLYNAIRGGDVHIATLNYDGLLSSFLKNRGMLGMGKGDAPPILDGFIDEKFDRSNMFRQKTKAHGICTCMGALCLRIAKGQSLIAFREVL